MDIRTKPKTGQMQFYSCALGRGLIRNGGALLDPILQWLWTVEKSLENPKTGLHTGLNTLYQGLLRLEAYFCISMAQPLKIPVLSQ